MISVENLNAVVTYPFGTILYLYTIVEMGHLAVVGKKLHFLIRWGYWSL